MKDQPGITKKKFLYNLSRASYQKNWGKKYQPPTFWERFLAFLTRIVPKVGPLKVLKLQTPTPETERMFEASFNATLDRYRKLLSQVDTGLTDLPNEEFVDTGEVTGPGLIDSPMRRTQSCSTRSLRKTLPPLRLSFGKSSWHSTGIRCAPYATKRNPKAWAKVQVQLEQLK